MDFDGAPFSVKGEFLEIDEPHLLRYRFGDDETVEVRIEAEGVGSHLYLSHIGLPSEAQQQIVNGGWSHALGLLAQRAAPSSRSA